MEVLEKYGLHDTKVYDALINENGITLIFNDGLYQIVDHKEYTLTKKCRIVIKIKQFSSVNLYEHIEVVCFRRNKFKEIHCLKFIELLNKNCFEIDDVFYSSFSETIIIKGFINKCRIEFIVSEISDIEVQFL